MIPHLFKNITVTDMTHRTGEDPILAQGLQGTDRRGDEAGGACRFREQGRYQVRDRASRRVPDGQRRG